MRKSNGKSEKVGDRVEKKITWSYIDTYIFFIVKKKKTTTQAVTLVCTGDQCLGTIQCYSDENTLQMPQHRSQTL